MWTQLAGMYPSIAELVTAVDHDGQSIVGAGCDDQFEFEFALDLMLDGLKKLKSPFTDGQVGERSYRSMG